MKKSHDLNIEEQITDENEIIAIRREKLRLLRENRKNAFPNDFKPTAFAKDLKQQFGSFSHDALEQETSVYKVAGRIMLKRIMGKASFIHIQDMTGSIQIYVRGEEVTQELYECFKTWDIGDIVGIQGKLFKTKTDELTIKAENIELLTKSLRPLPDKFHGLTDHESRYRKRYLDLLMNSETRELFQSRSKTLQVIRNFLNAQQFLEVETPMMQTLAGGAAAKPFVTHHNALGMDLYLRIAPELFLKRLVVGGLERVYEINRNFRNEGISTRHNPEFTMLEFYQAYSDYQDAMKFTELLLRDVVHHIVGSSQIQYQEHEINFSESFLVMTVKDAILKFNPIFNEEILESLDALRKIADELKVNFKPSDGVGKLQIEIFEKTVEHQLIQPTFITAYPTEVSPLARRNDQNPDVTDRFELFIAGREIANGFSELNDPEDQAARFEQQMKEKAAGDQEAMPYDEDYIEALEYGMPPVSGVGIGIDRLVMLLTNSPSIRDVLLFPHMRPD